MLILSLANRSDDLTFEIQLSASLECPVDKLESLPHSRGDALSSECTAVDDLEDLIVQICKQVNKRALVVGSMITHTVELVLKRDGDHRHKNSLEVQKDIRCALEGEDQSANSLKYTKCGNALLIQEVAVLAVVALLLVPGHEFANDTEVGVTELLAEGHSKGRELGSEDLNEVLHDIGQSIHINLVSQLEELLHDLGNVGLHVGSDDIVADERLESQSGGDTNGEAGVGHRFEDVAVDDDQVVGILEVQLLELLEGVASAGTEEALRTAELGEDVTDEEVLDLVGNWALLAQDDARESANHAQRALLLPWVLLAIRRSLISVYDLVDVVQDGESLLPPALGECNKEICGGDVRCGNVLIKVQLAVEVLLWLVVEQLDILIRLAQDGEDKMRDEVVGVRLQQSPHRLGLDAFVQEVQGVVQTSLRQPDLLADPLLDLLEVDLEDLGSEVGDEVLGDLGVIDFVVLAQC